MSDLNTQNPGGPKNPPIQTGSPQKAPKSALRKAAEAKAVDVYGDMGKAVGTMAGSKLGGKTGGKVLGKFLQKQARIKAKKRISEGLIRKPTKEDFARIGPLSLRDLKENIEILGKKEEDYDEPKTEEQKPPATTPKPAEKIAPQQEPAARRDLDNAKRKEAQMAKGLESTGLASQGQKQSQAKTAEADQYEQKIQAQIQAGDKAAKARGLGQEPGSQPGQPEIQTTAPKLSANEEQKATGRQLKTKGREAEDIKRVQKSMQRTGGMMQKVVKKDEEAEVARGLGRETSQERRRSGPRTARETTYIDEDSNLNEYDSAITESGNNTSVLKSLKQTAEKAIKMYDIGKFLAAIILAVIKDLLDIGRLEIDSWLWDWIIDIGIWISLTIFLWGRGGTKWKLEILKKGLIVLLGEMIPFIGILPLWTLSILWAWNKAAIKKDNASAALKLIDASLEKAVKFSKGIAKKSKQMS